MKKKLSIVIPTKNRSQYAIWTIKAATSISPDIEVIVADSSNNDFLEAALISEGIIEHVIYHKTSVNNTVVDNFNEGVSLARGKYITCIGDDDFITNNVINVIDYAIEKSIECINFSFPVTYWWPDFVHRKHGIKNASCIHITSYSSKVKEINAKATLHEAIQNFGGGLMNMPRIYAGIVSLDLIHRLNIKFNLIFGGVSPDIYSSTLIASECNKFVLIDFPIIIPGISAISGSGMSSNGTHIGKLRDNQHIAAFKDLIWDNRIPEFYSVPTVWSFSMLKALEKINLDDKINFHSLYLKCFIFFRQYNEYTMKSLKTHTRKKINRPIFVLNAFFYETKYIISTLYKRLKHKMLSRGIKEIKHINNSYEAFVVVNKEIPKVLLP